MAKALYRLILCGFKEKASAVFYGTAFRKRSFGSFFIGKGNGKERGEKASAEKFGRGLLLSYGKSAVALCRKRDFLPRPVMEPM